MKRQKYRNKNNYNCYNNSSCWGVSVEGAYIHIAASVSGTWIVVGKIG